MKENSDHFIDITDSIDCISRPDTETTNSDESSEEATLEELELTHIKEVIIKDDNNKTKIKIFLAFFFWVIILFAAIDSLKNQHLRLFFESTFSWIEDNPIPGFFLSLMISFVCAILFIPVSIITLGSSFVFAKEFGFVLGIVLTTLAIYTGATSGAVVSFLLGRYFFRNSVKRLSMNYPILTALDAALKEKGVRIMFLLHLSPILPYAAMNYIAGITAISFLNYFFALFGLLPGIMLYSFLGASASSLADSTSSQEKYEMIAMCLGLFFALLGFITISYYTRLELRNASQTKENILSSDNGKNQINDRISVREIS